MATTKTKAVVALGMLDLARQVATAYSAKQQAQRDRLGFGSGLREDVVRLARDTRDRLPEPPALQWGLPPWHRRPTMTDHVRTWAPIAAIVTLASAAVIVAAHVVARRSPKDPDAVVTDSRVVGAVRAGSRAIDAGVTRVVEGGSSVAVGSAAAVAAGSSAIRTAAVERAREELDHRVIEPAKKKAITIGVAGVLALTLYVVVIAALVQLLVEAL